MTSSFFAHHATAQSTSDLAQQVQAAELLANLLTYTVDRGDGRLKQMKEFIEQHDKNAADVKLPPRTMKTNYMQLFRAALLVVRDGHDPDVDPSLKGEQSAELYETLTRTQYYDMHQFLHFNQQRDEYDSMRAQLQAAGLFDQYSQSVASTGGVSKATSQPATSDSTAIAKRMTDLLHEMKETAWHEAQAAGTSRSQFDQDWPKDMAQYRNAVESRIEGFDAQASSLGKAQPAGTPPPEDQAYAKAPAPPTNAPGGNTAAPVTHSIPSPVQSNLTNANIADREDSVWGVWDYGR